MVTSAIIHKSLELINLPVDIRNVCVLLAPGFSGLTALATYLFTREMSGDGSFYSCSLSFCGFVR